MQLRISNRVLWLPICFPLLGLPVAVAAEMPAEAPVASGMNLSPLKEPETVSHVLGFWGVDVSKYSASTWIGALISPWTDLEKSGLRIWLQGEAGRYKYFDAGTEFKGNFQSGDLLVGRAFEGENYSINLLAGLNVSNHSVAPFDPENAVQGTELGFKVRGDAYWTPTAQTMTYGEYEYSTAFNTYWLSQKVGFDVADGKEIYIGPQVTFLGDRHSNQWRVGAHLSNLRIGKIQLDLSTGYANDSDVGAGAYGYLEMSLNF